MLNGIQTGSDAADVDTPNFTRPGRSLGRTGWHGASLRAPVPVRSGGRWEVVSEHVGGLRGLDLCLVGGEK